jgi:hypothetical protein
MAHCGRRVSRETRPAYSPKADGNPSRDRRYQDGANVAAVCSQLATSPAVIAVATVVPMKKAAPDFSETAR